MGTMQINRPIHSERDANHIAIRVTLTLTLNLTLTVNGPYTLHLLFDSWCYPYKEIPFEK